MSERVRFVRGFICTYDSEPLDELETSSEVGPWAAAAGSTRGGVGGCTTKRVGTGEPRDIASVERTRVMEAGGEDGADAEVLTDREDEDLRGMRGSGAPALLEWREYE